MNNVFKTLTFIFLITCGLSTPSLSQNAPVHAILETKGKVLVNNKNWQKPQIAFVGLSLNSDDTLDVPAKASVKIYCSDLSIWIVKPGKYKVSQGCPSGKTVILLPNSNNRTLRALVQSNCCAKNLT